MNYLRAFIFSVIIIPVCFAGAIFAQSNSLIEQIKKLPAEVRLDFIHDQVKELYKRDTAVASKELNAALVAFKSEKKLYASLLSEKATLLYKSNIHDKAALLEWEALKIFQSENDFELELQSIQRLSRLYKAMNKREELLEVIFNALKRTEGNDLKECVLLERLGVLFKELKNDDKAMNYLKQAEELSKQVNSTESIFIKSQLSIDKNLGVLYRNKKDHNKALYHFNKALALAESIDNSEYKAIILNSLGVLYTETGEFHKAIKAYEESVRLKEENEKPAGVSTSLANLGMLYMRTNNVIKAEDYLLCSYNIAFPLSDRTRLMTSCSHLAELYGKLNKPLKAYPYLRKAYELRDSIYSQSIAEETARMEAIYDTEKKQKEIEFRKLQNDQLEKSIEAKNRERNILIGGSLVLIVLLGWAINSFLGKKKANALLEDKNTLINNQKILVEEQHKEIVDSITYAKRLQDAILPSHETVSNCFNEYFIYYKPKSIVAGDFYWMETYEDHVLIGVADCTGHGVPGAMVSLVCSNALNRSVFEFGLTDPGEVLNKTRELVLETFSKSSADVKDGMDISLVSIHKQSNEIKWAGANNPLWYIKDGVFNEVTANKQPIGKADVYKPFTTHQIDLHKGDTVFLFSDGYADQFGGPKGKKLKYKQFQEILVSGTNKPLVETESSIESIFKSWMGELEQVDDVCVIGIRV